MKCGLKSGSSHLPQEFNMRNDSISYSWIFDIRNAILLANLFDYSANRGVMNMRNFRKQVVFDLEIQTTNQPTD